MSGPKMPPDTAAERANTSAAFLELKREQSGIYGQTVALKSCGAAWARYCINEGLSFTQYAKGFALLTGDGGDMWLLRGFVALEEAARE